MKRYFRDLIRDHARLYICYNRVFCQRKIILPGQNTDCHLTGFPRTANTYTRHLIRTLFPERDVVTHIHTIASLKQASKYSIPLVVIFRNPLDSVVSLALKGGLESSDRKAMAELLRDYTHYHDWVSNHSERLSLYRFEDITLHTEAFLYSLIGRLKWEMVPDLSGEIRKANEVFLKREKEKDPMGSSLPQDVRQKLKLRYVEVIQSCEEYSSAQCLYDCLLEQSVKCCPDI